MSKTWVNFTVLVDVWCYHPRTRGVVQVEDCALADVDEETNIFLAPG